MKRLIIFMFLILAVQLLQAQYVDEEEEDQEEQEKSAENDEDQKFTDRLVVGGNIQLSFGSYTVVGGSPMVGYKITDKLIGGVTGTYTYFRIDYPGYGRYENTLYGGSIFGRYLITEDFFAHSEFEVISWEVPRFGELIRTNVELFYVGGGYRMQIGGSSYVALTVLIDVFDNPDSPYQNPVFRGGFIFGL